MAQDQQDPLAEDQPSTPTAAEFDSEFAAADRSPGLRTAIFDFIEVFYNRQRRHSTLDYHPPAAYEHHHASPAPAA